jgi:hypothetical protein
MWAFTFKPECASQHRYESKSKRSRHFLEEFEDTKGAIRIRISKKNRQHNGQKKKYKEQTMIYKTLNIHIKL